MRTREISINSKHKPETIQEILNSVSDTWHKEGNKKQLFEGKVDSNYFNLKPVFDFGPRDQLRPLIKGEIKDSQNKTQIQIKFLLPSIFKNLLIAGNIACVILSIVLFTLPNKKEYPIGKFWWAILIFLPINYLIFNSYWNYKVDLSQKKLRQLLK